MLTANGQETNPYSYHELSASRFVLKVASNRIECSSQPTETHTSWQASFYQHCLPNIKIMCNNLIQNSIHSGVNSCALATSAFFPIIFCRRDNVSTTDFGAQFWIVCAPENGRTIVRSLDERQTDKHC